MESRAKLLGHPIHQMLIVFPLGLLVMSFIFDIIRQISGVATWAEVGYYMIGAGVVTGLLAAVFGFIDWLAIPEGTRAKSIGLIHGGGNVVVVLLFALSWWLRRDAPGAPGGGAVFLSALGTLLGAVTGWLGGELVGRLGVGVHPGANLDAPSSIRHKKIPGADAAGRFERESQENRRWRPSA